LRLSEISIGDEILSKMKIQTIDAEKDDGWLALVNQNVNLQE
jgi:hypothetical protein